MKNYLLGIWFLCMACTSAQAQLSAREIDELVHRTLKAFDVPGIAVCVVKDNRVVHAQGYGVRSLRTRLPVDKNTLFGIASNTKAFTAAALGMLMEEGKLTWDSKVTDFVPEFKMYDPYVTAEFTIRDLLTHRSGLGLGAGDLMFWPDENTFTKADIIHNLRYLRPVSSFRSKYDYDNLLYIVAGEVVARASGIPWEKFIQERFFKPMGMQASAPAFSLLRDTSNVIYPHFYVDGKLQVIRRDWSENANAAGGIYASVNDMAIWLKALLNGGKHGQHSLFSPATLKEMWSPQTLMPVGAPGPYNRQFASYGLGWVITDVKGRKQVSHTGGLAGIVTQTVAIPELQLGILVYTNQQSGDAFNAISNTIKDAYLGEKSNPDWVAYYQMRAQQAKGDAQAILDQVERQLQISAGRSAEFDIVGTYRDPWFGDVSIHKRDGKLWFTSKRSARLNGPMHLYKGTTYVVRWTDRSLDADAFVTFSLDTEGQANGMTMKAVSPLTDFSFDFHDLAFVRQK